MVIKLLPIALLSVPLTSPGDGPQRELAFPELAPIAGTLGAWEVVPPNGIRTQVEWILGGKAIASHWGVVGPDGRFDSRGVTVGTFDRGARKFRQLWYSSDLNFITEFEGEFLDGEFFYTGQGHRGEQKHLERTTTHSITESSRVWEMDKSFDGGETWQEGYTITRSRRVDPVEMRTARNEDGSSTFSIAELEPLNFLVGDWDIHSSSGLFRIQVRYTMGGKALASTFGKTNPTGELTPMGVTLRTFDQATGKYRMLWYDERLAYITEFEGKRTENGFSYDGHGHQGKRTFLERVEMYDIRADRHSWRRHVSYDQGKTWRENDWSYTAKRIPREDSAAPR